ncbi:sigma-54 interaction domain-containing protein [Alkalihalobacterium elongatum]|uniref:sigma-54 interaction domain-containing protein n=1 Tax=Alkalihalobacterium elongatum TaxID=2675466 RepID=UPI001C1F5D34|nr:sigma 54-interacting transcriptional regulator [Alkalihalobacterium elongatum]
MLKYDFNKEILEAVIDTAYECIVVVDKAGCVTYINQSYCEFLGVKMDDVFGKHVTEVIENTRMHEVLETGKEEIAQLHYLNGTYMIANRVPIRHNGEIIGAVGNVVYRDKEEWQQMNTHIKGLMSQLEYYREEWQKTTGVKYSLGDIVGKSEKIQQIHRQVQKVAASDISILLRGESGTGKELFAHAIHQLSNRSQKPFVKVNCGAIPEHLLESELFGYEEGAFTGAKKGGKPGKFQLANSGTIFLDEIGDMPLNMQVKLLRVLQEKEIEPVGAVKSKVIDVRVITATNRPLEKMVKEGRFREDLFYRVNVIPITIPPLRERVRDIILIAYALIEKITQKVGKRKLILSQEVEEVLLQYHWPGNVRELENVIEAAVHFASGNVITIEALPQYLKENVSLSTEEKTLKEILEETERKVIKNMLIKNNYDKLKTAKSLNISKSSFYEKLAKYKLKY